MKKRTGFLVHLKNGSSRWRFSAGSIMEIELPPDFKEFLKLLKDEDVKYLLIGGYAVGYHGYPRATNDIDVWIAVEKKNAEKVTGVLNKFGFNVPELTPELFLQKDRIIRMGIPPMRIEITTGISGVEFDDCYSERVSTILDGVQVDIIDLPHLKINKKAAGRLKDLADLENLP
jgi:hypothetical protein